jgi:hypothetical protein
MGFCDFGLPDFAVAQKNEISNENSPPQAAGYLISKQ